MNMKKNNWGGKRKNSGLKNYLENAKKILIAIPEETIERICKYEVQNKVGHSKIDNSIAAKVRELTIIGLNQVEKEKNMKE